MFLKKILLLVAFLLPALCNAGWQEEFAKMPLLQSVSELNETNVTGILLPAFKKNPVVKALIFMPGATDEFYFFHRARAALSNDAPTLLDAIVALTSQTQIQATVRAPFLVLHTAEDPLEPIIVVEDQATADRLRQKNFKPYAIYDDKDWDTLHPDVKHSIGFFTRLLPGLRSTKTYHFFRNNFAAYDLTAWETLEAMAMTGKTQFKVQKRKITFDGDPRYMIRATVPNGFLKEYLPGVENPKP